MKESFLQSAELFLFHHQARKYSQVLIHTPQMFIYSVYFSD